MRVPSGMNRPDGRIFSSTDARMALRIRKHRAQFRCRLFLQRAAYLSSPPPWTSPRLVRPPNERLGSRFLLLIAVDLCAALHKATGYPPVKSAFGTAPFHFPAVRHNHHIHLLSQYFCAVFHQQAVLRLCRLFQAPGQIQSLKRFTHGPVQLLQRQIHLIFDPFSG